MRGEVQFSFSRLVVLIDADNSSADLIEPLLKEISKYGTAHVKRIYGDWTSSQLGKWKDKLVEFAIQPIQQFAYTKGKNSTDSALIIDAMDLLYTQKFDGFCIVSSDSDFTRLANRIRESGLVVYGFGERKTPKAFISACDKFIYTEILKYPEETLVTQTVKSTADTQRIASPPLTSVPAGMIESEKPASEALNGDLMHLLKDAYEVTSEEDGWANLGPFGAQLTKLSSSFDPRNYGYRQLSKLIRATDVFEIKEIPHRGNPTVKELHIKLKASKS